MAPIDDWLSEETIIVSPLAFPNICLMTDVPEAFFENMSWMYTCDTVEKVVLGKLSRMRILRDTQQHGSSLQFLWYIRKKDSTYYLNHYRYGLHALANISGAPRSTFAPVDGTFEFIPKTVNGQECYQLKSGDSFLSLDPGSFSVIMTRTEDVNTCWKFAKESRGGHANARFKRWDGKLPFPRPGDNTMWGGESAYIRAATGSTSAPLYYNFRLTRGRVRLVVPGSSEDNSDTLDFRFGGIDNPVEIGYVYQNDSLKRRFFANAFWKRSESTSTNRYVKTGTDGSSLSENSVVEKGDGNLELIGKTLNMFVYTGWDKYFIATGYKESENELYFMYPTTDSGNAVQMKWMEAKTLMWHMIDNNENLNLPPLHLEIVWLKFMD